MMNVERVIASDTGKKKAKIWNATFTSLFLANIFMYLGHQMCNTLVAKYADYIGASTLIIGLVSSSYAITALIFKLISAPAIDAFNRKYILFFAMCVMGLSLAGYSISRTIPVLMGSRLLQGVGQAFTATCCLTMASDSLPSDKMAQGIGYFSLAQASCQAIGPTIGLKLVEVVGYHATFAIGAAIIFIGAFCVLQIKVSYKSNNKFRFSIRNVIAKEAVIPAVVMFFLTLAFCNINSFLVLYADELGIENIGYFFTVYALALFLRPLTGKLVDKYGNMCVLIPAMILFAIAFFIISIARSLPVFLIAAFISAIGYGSCLPTVQALSMRLVPKERRGAGSCTAYIGQDLANFAGPTIAGALIGVFGYSSMWRLMILPIFGAVLTVIFFHRIFNAFQ